MMASLEEFLKVLTIGSCGVGSVSALLLANIPKRWTMKNYGHHLGHVYGSSVFVPRRYMTPLAVKLYYSFWISITAFIVSLVLWLLVSKVTAM